MGIESIWEPPGGAKKLTDAITLGKGSCFGRFTRGRKGVKVKSHFKGQA